MDDASDVGTGDSGVESISSNEIIIMNVSVSIPDLNIQKFLQFNQEETVWKAKQQILSSFAKDLKDGFNYGFYSPPMNGKAGKFLDEERFLKEYSINGSLWCLEFKMKRRVYKSMNTNPKRSKQLHSKSNLKQFMDHVRRGEANKMLKQLNKGLDPNFVEPDGDGETPLTLACLIPRLSLIVLTLVGGGAHLDFRNKKGLTPLHVAAHQGNEDAIKILLDLGSSANYKDLRGLTPLYHGVSNDASARCVEMLLFDHSSVDATDEHGWTELHQSCKFGRVQHVELLIYYGANLNRQNFSGNTPLHISVINDQDECLRTLLFRGADKTIVNNSNQDPYDCALVSTNTRLAQIIHDFNDQEAVPYQDVPMYNNKRRSVYHQVAVGTLKRSRSNPLMNSSSNYEPVEPIDTSTMERGHEPYNDLTLRRTDGRSTGVQDVSISGHYPPLQSFDDSNQSFSMSSADSSQVEGEVNLAEKLSEDLRSRTRLVVLYTDSPDFGFILRGIKADRMISSRMDIMLTQTQPGLQYFEHVKANSMADKAGIKPGDFLLEVNGVDVTSASHEFTVSLIRNSVRNLQMLVRTPKKSSAYNCDSIDSRKNSNSKFQDLSAKEIRNSLSFKSFPSQSITESNGPDQKVASIRSVHGKRLAHNLPRDDPESVRVVSVPPYNSNSLSRKFLWKAKSVHNLSGSDDICYMFDDRDDSEASANDRVVNKESKFFGMFGINAKDKKFDGRQQNKFSDSNHIQNLSPKPAFKKLEQKLSSFFPKSELLLDFEMTRKLSSKHEHSSFSSPAPPPNLNNYSCSNELMNINKRQDFLTLAESARQVFLKHQKPPTLVKNNENNVNHKDEGSGDDNDNNGDDDDDLRKRYTLEPIPMYHTAREISKLALVSNRRHIFEGYSHKVVSNQSVEPCPNPASNRDSPFDKQRRKSPFPPKPPQKPIIIHQNNIPSCFQTVQQNSPRSDVFTNREATTINVHHRTLPSIPNASMDVSFTSFDPEILLVPPPPGFEDDEPSPDSNSDRALPKKTNRYNEPMESWSVADVCDWLETIGMGEHKKAFARNCIDGRVLSTLGRNEFISLGVVKVGHRMGLERAVKKILISRLNS